MIMELAFLDAGTIVLESRLAGSALSPASALLSAPLSVEMVNEPLALKLAMMETQSLAMDVILSVLLLRLVGLVLKMKKIFQFALRSVGMGRGTLVRAVMMVT